MDDLLRAVDNRDREPRSSEPAGRSTRPDDSSWRADALVGSRHSRLLDELREPLDLHDAERAREVCGAVTRLALGDFTPALLRLGRPHRLRCQALATYALTLFDFAAQGGPEGERLASINRWEFELEKALRDQPTGQPVFVLLHACHEVLPWPREGFTRLHAVARRYCTIAAPADRRAAEREAEILAQAVVWLLLGREPDSGTTLQVAAIFRAAAIAALPEAIRRHRVRLPANEFTQSPWHSESQVWLALGPVAQAECRRLLPILQSASENKLPKSWRSSARYCRRAALASIRRVLPLLPKGFSSPPQLGLGTRLRLLLLSLLP